MQALENTGSEEWAPGTYNVTIVNANVINVTDSWGWSFDHADNGSASGTLTLVRLLAC